MTDAMIDDERIAAAIEVHRAAIQALEDMRSQARTPTAPVKPAPAIRRNQPTARPRWELAARAFRRFPFEPHTVRRICADHPEWAKKFRDGQWFVNVDLFDPFADLVEAGVASFAVSAKFAVSVAADAQLAITFDQQSDAHGNESVT
ncbi:hypothetical protein IVA78_00845 [Bradyrhizobium sp. 137]|uniref:hypothetical protein n=1 Tax=Bradyrhizobium sp. 137 TaxID=2782614 RepID=UPI001FF89717|nr:hypothetical protein [Bradyrhizobium sp. 137]MCK1753806.1 hypothetical protein [Bradyrhizobium sp. 137]